MVFREREGVGERNSKSDLVFREREREKSFDKAREGEEMELYLLSVNENIDVKMFLLNHIFIKY